MNENPKDFHDERKKNNIIKIREIAKDMPSWFREFLRASETTLTPLTMLNYCYDTKIFLNYLTHEQPSCLGLAPRDIDIDRLKELTLTDLEIYVEYLGYYVSEDEAEHENSERGKARKIASLRSVFKYLYKKELLDANPAELLDMPKLHDKAIIRLSSDEIKQLIHIIESGEGLTERQKKLQTRTAQRDIAIVTLFLTTGIRISELVGLDILDLNFKDSSFRITRKGGNQSILYFGDETASALQNYLEERKNRGTYSLSSPLFLSSQNARISVRAVEYLVKKYAKIAAPLKRITPHKLRSTYGTMLYQETGDIYLVADVLGHKDINTTKKHYAAMSEENRKQAAKAIRLRD